MQRALHAGAVVRVEVADHSVDGVDVRVCDFSLQQALLALREAGRGHAPEVQHDFDQVVGGAQAVKGLLQLRRQDFAQSVDVVGDAAFPGDLYSSLPKGSNAPSLHSRRGGRLERARHGLQAARERRESSLAHAGGDVAQHHGLTRPWHEAEINQRILQPVLIAAHRHVDRHPRSGAVSMVDSGGEDGGGLAEDVRVQAGRQVDALAPFRDGDVPLHALMFAIHQADAVRRRLCHRLHQARHDVAIQQLDALRVPLLFHGQFHGIHHQARHFLRPPLPDLLARVDREAGDAHGLEERLVLVDLGAEQMRAALAGGGSHRVQQGQPGAVVGARLKARRDGDDARALRLLAHAELADDLRPAAPRQQGADAGAAAAGSARPAPPSPGPACRCRPSRCPAAQCAPAGARPWADQPVLRCGPRRPFRLFHVRAGPQGRPAAGCLRSQAASDTASISVTPARGMTSRPAAPGVCAPGASLDSARAPC